MEENENKKENKTKGRISGFFDGFTLPFRGFKTIVSSFTLLKLAILPAIINIGVFILLYYAGEYIYDEYVFEEIAPNLIWYLKFLYTLLYVLKIIFGLFLYLLVCFFLFSTVGGILAAPFLDILSEKAEFLILNDCEETAFSLKLLLLDIIVILSQESKKLFIWLGFTIITLPLLLIPLAGQILFSIPNVCLAAYFLGLAFIDFSVSRRRFNNKERKVFRQRNFWEIMGLGMAVYVTILIPFVGFICLPICTVGGTLLFCKNATKEELIFRRPDIKKIEEDKYVNVVK